MLSLLEYRFYVVTTSYIETLVIGTLMQCASISNKSHYFLLHLSTNVFIGIFTNSLILQEFFNIKYEKFLITCAFSNVKIKNKIL